MEEFILQQDFFFEYIALRENIGLFITLSELNKDFNSAIKLYKENKTTWTSLCKRDFLKYMPKDDDEWSLHFQKIKPGNYFGMYCYLNRVLNQEYDIENGYRDAKILTYSDGEIAISIPLYFVLKKYDGLKGQNLMCIPRSTRKMAIIIRTIDNTKKENLILEKIFNLKPSPRVADALFIYSICERDGCLQCILLKDLKVYPSHLKEGLYCDKHIRDEDNCSKRVKTSTPRFRADFEIAGICAKHGFEGFSGGLITNDGWEYNSLCFSENKIFSLA